MTKRAASCADAQDNGTGSILVWNGLVSRMGRMGGERQGLELQRPPTTHTSESEACAPEDDGDEQREPHVVEARPP